MPLLKAQKKELAQHYVQQLEKAKNIVILKQHGLPVNEITHLRKGVSEAEGKLEVVKKRVFLKGIEANGGYDGVTLDTLEGSIVLLYSYNEADEHAPLKTIQKQKKVRAKEKLSFGLDYLGGWYDKVWQTGSYVNELASLPSKEELVGKFLFLLNHPISSFARVLNAIAEKDGVPSEEVPPSTTETPAEVPAEESAPAETTTENPAESAPEAEGSAEAPQASDGDQPASE